NLYTINLHEMASASPICLMAHASSTKSWLWHQRVYNRRTKKIMKTMNVSFDEIFAMAFEQRSSKPGLNSMTSGQICSGLDLTYASPSERNLDILFEPLHNEYLGGQPSEALRTILAAPMTQNLQAPTASMSFQDSTPVPSNSLNTPVSSHNVDVPSPQHAQQQRNHTPSPTVSDADNVSNAVFEGDLFVNPFGTPSTEVSNEEANITLCTKFTDILTIILRITESPKKIKIRDVRFSA
nr:integrase, catalytic region, zinc finger, CCHC-type, peptidase aspartic, catalytic [Tanacetum cinerariifolium]